MTFAYKEFAHLPRAAELKVTDDRRREPLVRDQPIFDGVDQVDQTRFIDRSNGPAGWYRVSHR